MCVIDTNPVECIPMRVLEVSLNGNLLCRAGTDEECALNTIVTCIKGGSSDECWCDVGASIGHSGDHANWVSQKRLTVGDEITIKITDSNSADVPLLYRPEHDQR